MDGLEANLCESSALLSRVFLFSDAQASVTTIETSVFSPVKSGIELGDAPRSTCSGSDRLR